MTCLRCLLYISYHWAVQIHLSALKHESHLLWPCLVYCRMCPPIIYAQMILYSSYLSASLSAMALWRMITCVGLRSFHPTVTDTDVKFMHNYTAICSYRRIVERSKICLTVNVFKKTPDQFLYERWPINLVVYLTK